MQCAIIFFQFSNILSPRIRFRIFRTRRTDTTYDSIQVKLPYRFQGREILDILCRCLQSLRRNRRICGTISICDPTTAKLRTRIYQGRCKCVRGCVRISKGTYSTTESMCNDSTIHPHRDMQSKTYELRFVNVPVHLPPTNYS